MRLYATTDDAWPTNPPANADLLLRTASRTVDALAVGRVYDVDDAGLPTDPDVAQAMQDACVAIALECQTTGVLEAGATEGFSNVSIGSVTLSGKTSEGAATVDGIPVPAVVATHLSVLGPVQVWVGGTWPC